MAVTLVAYLFVASEDVGVRQSDLVNWYLTEIESEITSQAGLLEKQAIMDKVITKLIDDVGYRFIILIFILGHPALGSYTRTVWSMGNSFRNHHFPTGEQHRFSYIVLLRVVFHIVPGYFDGGHGDREYRNAYLGQYYTGVWFYAIILRAFGVQ